MWKQIKAFFSRKPEVLLRCGPGEAPVVPTPSTEALLAEQLAWMRGQVEKLQDIFVAGDWRNVHEEAEAERRHELSTVRTEVQAHLAEKEIEANAGLVSASEVMST